MKPFKHSFLKIFFLLLCFVGLAFLPGCNPSSEPAPGPVVVDDEEMGPGYPDVPAPDYWPTTGWQTTSPEQQGMDSGRLADLVEFIQVQNYHIRSMLVIRNGYLVTEAYFHPFQAGIWHIIHSCTKSINSALVGIAIGQGLMAGENIGVLDYFPEYNVANVDDRKRELRLKHLLKMTTGLNARDSYLYNWEGLNNMRNTDDWTKYVLDLPMANAPGSTFDYSNCASFLIGSMLHKATGISGLEYAGQHLFSPLGISTANVEWPVSPNGIVTGWGRMRMRPVDMAKFGFLYLHKGHWDGSQVVPAEWVDHSTRRRMTANTFTQGYGYQWWVDEGGVYFALGYGGQYIFVNPAQNLVTVVTSAFSESNAGIPGGLYADYVLDAIRSDSAIAENPQARERLDTVVQAATHPEPEAVPALPATAGIISGRVYRFEPDEYEHHTIGLTFTPGSDEVQFHFAYRDRNLNVPAGLDNVYRTTFQFEYWRSYKGRWVDDNTFLIDYQIADACEWGYFRLTFSGNSVTVVIRNDRTGSQAELTAHYTPPATVP